MRDLVIQPSQSVGHLHLNRPQALNALSMTMVQAMFESLLRWKDDSAIASVFVSGEGRAFCAGGDVKAVCQTASSPEFEVDHQNHDFFRAEYRLNELIASYSKPYICWLDGITFGGGVGISILGSHRIASEHFKFAMPETTIGFFPDVGGSYFLSRLGPIGTWLALTGTSIDAAMAMELGIVTHFVPQSQGTNLLDHIRDFGIDEALSRSSKAVAKSEELERLRPFVDACFSTYDWSEIVKSLRAVETDPVLCGLAQETLATLYEKSPTSLLVTLELLRRGKEFDLKSCLQMEYRVSQRCLVGHDFQEGVRAMLIDKDRQPVWNPSSIESIESNCIDGYFYSLGDRELSF